MSYEPYSVHVCSMNAVVFKEQGKIAPGQRAPQTRGRPFFWKKTRMVVDGQSCLREQNLRALRAVENASDKLSNTAGRSIAPRKLRRCKSPQLAWRSTFRLSSPLRSSSILYFSALCYDMLRQLQPSQNRSAVIAYSVFLFSGDCILEPVDHKCRTKVMSSAWLVMDAAVKKAHVG